MKKKILIILLLTNLLLLGVGGTYAAYRDEAVGTINEFNFAKIFHNITPICRIFTNTIIS